MDALRSLIAAGLTPEQIVALGREAERRRQRLLQAGYSPLYVSALSGPELFAVSEQATLPVVAGTEEMDRELQARIAAESALQARADAAVALLRLLLEQAQARAEAERSPFRFVDFLRNVSRLPRGEAAHVIQSLTGRQLYIEPKLPVETERERQLWDRLLEYARPESPFVAESRGTLREKGSAGLPPGVTEVDVARVREAYARDPVAAQRFFEEAARNPEGVRKMFGAYARGGELVADEPIVGVGLATLSPRFLLGEAGPERLRITPMRWPRLVGFPKMRLVWRAPLSNALRPIWGRPYGVRTFGRGGQVRVVTTKGRTFLFPRGPLFPKRVGEYLRKLADVTPPPPAPPPPAPPQGEASLPEETVSPAQAAAMAMGRALQNNPFAPRELVNQLLAGQAPSPGYVTQQLVANLDPQLYKGLLGVAEAFGVLPEQFEQARRAFFVPGARVYVQRF